MHDDISALPKGAGNQAHYCISHTGLTIRALKAWHSPQLTPPRGRRKEALRLQSWSLSSPSRLSITTTTESRIRGPAPAFGSDGRNLRLRGTVAYGVTMARPPLIPGTASSIPLLENAQPLDFYYNLENGWLGSNTVDNTKPPTDVDGMHGVGIIPGPLISLQSDDRWERRRANKASSLQPRQSYLRRLGKSLLTPRRRLAYTVE